MKKNKKSNLKKRETNRKLKMSKIVIDKEINYKCQNSHG